MINIITNSKSYLSLGILLFLNFFNAHSQDSCYTIENITNGNFQDGSTAGWNLGGKWIYGNTLLGVVNVTQPATNHILSQVISTPLTTQLYKFSFRMGTHDLNSGDRSKTATLEIKIGGITYAKFTNGTGSNNNVTLELFNGATSDFVPYGTTTGWVGSKVVNFDIPFNASSALNNEIEYIYNSTGDYFSVHSVSFLSCDSELPVRLSHFGVRKSGSDVLLDWETATEASNSHFDIQMSSDAVNFLYLGTIAGHGSTEVGQKYSYVHKNPAVGITYYRLKTER